LGVEENWNKRNQLFGISIGNQIVNLQYFKTHKVLRKFLNLQKVEATKKRLLPFHNCKIILNLSHVLKKEATLIKKSIPQFLKVNDYMIIV